MTTAEHTAIFQLPSIITGQLSCVEGTVAGETWTLTAGTFSIGRSAEVDLPLPDEEGVSKQHAKIVAEGLRYVLYDNESRNGTLVNGKPVQRAELTDGDEIRVCGCVLRFAQVQATSANGSTRAPATPTKTKPRRGPNPAGKRRAAPVPKARRSPAWLPSFLLGNLAALLLLGGPSFALGFFGDVLLGSPPETREGGARDGGAGAADSLVDGGLVDGGPGEGTSADAGEGASSGEALGAKPGKHGRGEDGATGDAQGAADEDAADEDAADEEADVEGADEGLGDEDDDEDLDEDDGRVPDPRSDPRSLRDRKGTGRKARGGQRARRTQEARSSDGRGSDADPPRLPTRRRPAKGRPSAGSGSVRVEEDAEPPQAAPAPRRRVPGERTSALSSEWFSVRRVASEPVVVRAPMEGKIRVVQVDAGARVVEGETIAELDQRANAAKIATLRESIRALETVAESQPEAQDYLQKEQAKLSSLLAAQRTSVLIAPITGRITELYLQAGDKVRARQVAAKILPEDANEVYAEVPREVGARLDPGGVVEYRLAGGRTRRGRIRAVQQRRGAEFRVLLQVDGIDAARLRQVRFP